MVLLERAKKLVGKELLICSKFGSYVNVRGVLLKVEGDELFLKNTESIADMCESNVYIDIHDVFAIYEVRYAHEVYGFINR